jgi:signal transduction histidine kinase
VYLALTGLLALAGLTIPRRAPSHIVQLRRRLENAVNDELPNRAVRKPTSAPNDFDAINDCMKILIQELRSHIEAMEGERKELQQHLTQAQKVEGLGTMATGIAHDFNNLIAAVLGNVSIVLRAMPSDGPSRESALQIQASATQAIELTNKLAIYSGRCRLNPVTLDLSAAVRELSDLIATTVYKGIAVQYNLAEDLPGIEADPNQVREMVKQLVQNASEAITTRTRKGTITITTGVKDCDRAYLEDTFLRDKSREGRYVFLDVADDGCGMSPEIQARIFDPFFTTKIRAQGLGLSVVLGIVRAHSGAIRVRSAPAEGTSIRVLLPCQETKPALQS